MGLFATTNLLIASIHEIEHAENDKHRAYSFGEFIPVHIKKLVVPLPIAPVGHEGQRSPPLESMTEGSALF